MVLLRLGCFVIVLVFLLVLFLLLFGLLTADVKLLVECAQLSILVRAFRTQVVETPLEVVLFHLNFINFVLLLLQLASNVCDVPNDHTFLRLRRLQFARELLVAGFQALQQHKLLIEQDKLKLGILEIALEPVLLELHLMDFPVELAHGLIDFFLDLSLLELELNTADHANFAKQIIVLHAYV